MAASPSYALLRRIPCFATLVQVLILHQARLLPLAVAKTNLTTDEKLPPPEYITSPSGDFAFGFLAHDSDPDMYILATWCRFTGGDGSSSQPQPQSVVWFAKVSNDNMGATPNATAGSVLSIQRLDGQLTLTDAGGTNLWKASSSGGKRGNIVTLSDSGNVQFLGDGGQVLWSSFAYPTDTLLPGQSLQGALFSKRAEAEFTTGRFSLAVQADGYIVLCKDLFTGDTLNNALWGLGTKGGNTTITMDNNGDLNYTLHVDGTVVNRSFISPMAMPSGNSSNYFQFARVDTDGIVRTYFRPKNSSHNTSWTVSGRHPRDGGCNMTTGDRHAQGMCGPGSYCVETMGGRLDCLCPPRYTYIDAQHRDSGCTPEFEPQSCGAGNSDNSSEQFSLVPLPNTTWELSMYYKKFPSVTEKQCREYCLNDCYCAAALMDGSHCVEVAALINGRKADNISMPALIKVRQGNTTTTTYTETPSSARTKTILRPYKMVAICLASLLFITVGVLLAYIIRNRRDSRQQSLSSSAVRAFSWKELYQATNGFKELLGKGSFGEVYKGTMMRSSPQPLLIAVKKLIDSNDYSEQEFTNEVQSIGQIHHRYLVRMIGYCKEGKHRMLVFEFMPGGSLRSFLFKAEKRLPWRQRAEAALAVARGLEYLHDGCSTPVIHCDIKPDNILIDGHGIARITDFGISKLLGSQQVHTTVTHVRGTRGYIAPEWLRGDARVDTKVDVYSFGVLLLELISCRRCQDPLVNYLPPGAGAGTGAEDDDETTTVTLFGWAAQLVVARRTELMLHHDADDVGTAGVGDMEQVEQFARVALWCMEPNPLLRPTMHQVVQMLETSDWAQVQALPDPAECYMESSPLIIPQLIKIE